MKKLFLAGALWCAFVVPGWAAPDMNVNQPTVLLPDGSKAVRTTAVNANGTAVTGGGDASAANQTAVQANAGSDASKAVAVQGVTSGKPISVSQSASTSITVITPYQGVKAVASAGTPVLLVAAQTLVESFEIHARKSTTVANTGNIYVGFSSTAGQNYRVLVPGEAWGMTAVAGKKIDLHTIYLDAATSADAVTYTAQN